ncbi:MAG: hypothetical protein JWN14_156 [Chthonomonadales bacterium]|nr:hypothetical protein [Chthonomonadales bacterium]
MGGSRQAGIRITVFGALRVQIEGADLDGLHERHTREVLACLALNYHTFVSSDTLLDRFFSEASSPAALRQSLSHLRGLLGSERERIEVYNGAVRLRVGPAECDLVQFDTALQEGDLATAVRLYQGPLLEDWSDKWIDRDRKRRHEKYLQALKRLAEEKIQEGDPATAIPYLDRYVRYLSGEEWAWVSLMQAQVALSERAAALQTLQRCTRLFEQTHGLAPPAAMLHLAQGIREPAVASGIGHPEGADRLETLGGAMPLGSSLYVVRDSDEELQSALGRQDSLIVLKGARQTGKSSLLARGLHYARSLGATTLVTSFDVFEPSNLDTLETVCLRLAASLAEHLDLDTLPDTVWKPMLGPHANLELYLHRYALTRSASPLVWGMDNVDRLFARPWHTEFFAMLRSWHDKRAFEPHKQWRRLTLAFTCTAEPHLYIQDLNKSPFNIGTRILVRDFTPEHTATLNQRVGSPLHTPDDLATFYRLVGGHPYLTRYSLQVLAGGSSSLGTFIEQAADEDGTFGDHLRRMLHRLEEHPDLRAAVTLVLQGKACDETAFLRLRSMGMLSGSSSEHPQLRCDLYARYLARRLT